MKTCDHWRKEARKTNDLKAWASYRSLRGEVKRNLRVAEREFIAEQIRTNPNNTRCLWKTIRSCVPKKSAGQKTFAKDHTVVANEFNSFFSSVGQTTTSKINSLAKECNYDLTQSEFIKPRSYPESEQFIFETVDTLQARALENGPSPPGAVNNIYIIIFNVQTCNLICDCKSFLLIKLKMK